MKSNACRRLASAAAFAVGLAAASRPASAQQPTPAPKPCSTPEYRQFDYWLGDWDVTRADNQKPAGKSSITSILGGCGIHESWAGAGGGHGESINAYDASDGKWRQTWVDVSGQVLLLSGGLKDGAMVMESAAHPAPGQPGKMLKNRVTWSKVDGGRVRQQWESTTDDGKTWTIVFAGIYQKKGA